MEQKSAAYHAQEKVLQYIGQHQMICAHEKILVGVSGGSDSMCLLFLLWSLKDKLDITVEALHVNHMIREAAADDERFVECFCKEQQIPFHVKTVDVPAYVKETGFSPEEAARELRYKAFDEVLRELGADRIALAHHVQDQAETMLFRLCRGTGLEGLCAMKPVRGRIIRPLLLLSKEEILSYLKENGLSYVTDESNFDNVYSRNCLRNEVFPILEEKVVKGSAAHMAKAAERLMQAQDYLSVQVKAAFAECVQVEEKGSRARYLLELAPFRAQHAYLQGELIKKLLAAAAGSEKDLQAVHVEDMLTLAEKQTGSRISLPYRLSAQRVYDTIVLQKEESADEKAESGQQLMLLSEGEGDVGFLKTVELAGFGFVKIRVFYRQKDRNIPTKPYTKWLDYDRIKKPVVLRIATREDYFYCDDEHRKRVFDYMKDEKIPSGERAHALIVASGEHMLYFVGGRISNYVKISDTTTRILEIAVEKTEEKDGRENRSHD